MNWYNHRMRYFQLSEFDSPDAPGSGAKMDKEFLPCSTRPATSPGFHLR